MKTRAFNIIERAASEFGYEYDMDDTLNEILDGAMNAITDAVDYDRIEVCERSRHYDHVSWMDDKDFQYEADGQFIRGDDSKNTYFRRDEKGDFQQIEWFEHNEDDYILMDTVIDTDGQVVWLICQ